MDHECGRIGGRWPRRVACCLLLVVWGSGCGPASPAGKVRVTGKVTYAAEPPEATAIFFVAKQGSESTSAKVGPDGGFVVVLSPGEYAVSMRELPGPMDEKGNVTVVPSRIPKKYNSPQTSGLGVVVTKDAKPLSIALEPLP